MRACGRQYGEAQAERIAVFMEAEGLSPDRQGAYAAQCWRELVNWQQPVVEFVRGMADGCGRSVEEMTLLILHEEVIHSEHCTAFGATAAATRDGDPVVAQNWDWSPKLFPWPHLLRVKSNATPAVLTYAYPGLWASAGVNEHGLALVWTGAGYYPSVPPLPGIPTYALIAGILQCESCSSAARLVAQTSNAGCFIFLLADTQGDLLVIEGWPGSVHMTWHPDCVGLANQFVSETACRATNQKLPPASVAHTTQARHERVLDLLASHRGSMEPGDVQSILRDHGAAPGCTICQHADPARETVTIDSFYALPVQRELWIARGPACRHEFERHGVADGERNSDS